MGAATIERPKQSNKIVVNLNFITVLLLYGAIILFYMSEMNSIEPGKRGVEVWLNKFVQATVLSTFTYVLPGAIQGIFASVRDGLVISNMWLLVIDILYILVYGLFPQRKIWLNIALCVITVILAFWASCNLVFTSKNQKHGQDDMNNMEEQQDADCSVEHGSVSANF